MCLHRNREDIKIIGDSRQGNWVSTLLHVITHLSRSQQQLFTLKSTQILHFYADNDDFRTNEAQNILNIDANLYFLFCFYYFQKQWIYFEKDVQDPPGDTGWPAAGHRRRGKSRKKSGERERERELCARAPVRADKVENVFVCPSAPDKHPEGHSPLRQISSRSQCAESPSPPRRHIAPEDPPHLATAARATQVWRVPTEGGEVPSESRGRGLCASRLAHLRAAKGSALSEMPHVFFCLVWGLTPAVSAEHGVTRSSPSRWQTECFEEVKQVRPSSHVWS